MNALSKCLLRLAFGLLVPLVATACQKPLSPLLQADIPSGRTLVRDGLGQGGSMLLALDDAPSRCREPQAWRLEGAAWRQTAAGPALAAEPCPPVTARLAGDARTLAVYDYSAGRAEVFELGRGNMVSAGRIALTATSGFSFPPPGPNLAFSADGRQLLLGALNRACRPLGAGRRACGVAELFERGEGGWKLRTTLLPLPERDGRIRFGQSVALAPLGDLAVVGGTGEPGRSGALWVFALDGDEPRVVQILAPRRRQGGFANDLSLSSDGHWLAVGGEQSVQLYERLGDGFAFRKLLTPPHPDAGYFGETVALSGDGSKLAVGAPRTACPQGERCGRVYLFERNRFWQPTRIVQPAALSSEANFGHHIALSDDGRRLAVQGALLHVFTFATP